MALSTIGMCNEAKLICICLSVRITALLNVHLVLACSFNDLITNGHWSINVFICVSCNRLRLDFIETLSSYFVMICTVYH